MFGKDVENQLERLRKNDRDRIIVEFIHLRRNPFCGKKLAGKYKGFYLIHVGDYKILYEVYKKQLSILIVKIGRRVQITDISWLVQLRKERL